jgi:hypothetical protein
MTFWQLFWPVFAALVAAGFTMELIGAIVTTALTRQQSKNAPSMEEMLLAGKLPINMQFPYPSPYVDPSVPVSGGGKTPTPTGHYL